MKNKIGRILISTITFILLLAMCFGVVSALAVSAYAVEQKEKEDPIIYQLYGMDIKKSQTLDLATLSYLESINDKVNDLLSRPVTENITNIHNTAIQNTLIGININEGEQSKPKKTDAKDITKKATSVLKEVNNELPGLLKSIKNGTFTDDYLNNTDKMLSIVSTVAGMCGPYGQAAAAVIDITRTVYNFIMGGVASSSEQSRMEDRLTQQMQSIQNDLSNIEDSIKTLSNELAASTQRIIDAMPVALDRQDDKNRLEKFWKSYDGNFSYGDFYNYVNGSLKGNSKASSAYYALLQSALRNGGSDELIKRRYDDLYYAIEKNIQMFEDQIVSENNVKSIVKVYYDYISSNKEWLAQNEGTTPEMAAVEFAHELYQTLQTADNILAMCHTYHYIQALLSQEHEGEYYDYMGRFAFAFNDDELDAYYDAIDTREDNVRDQFAKDLAEILIGTNYIVEDQGNFYESTTGSVVKGQIVYLYMIPESVCEWFDLDPLDYTYANEPDTNSQLLQYNYFEFAGGTKNVYLQYDGSVVLAFSFSKNDNVFAGGTGTQDDPYLISTKEQFLKIGNGLDKHYRLTRDIDFEDASISAIGLSQNSDGGEVITAFTGSLDGNGFSIKDLKIGKTGDTYAGLFAKIGATGIVEDLTFENVTVSAEYGNLEKSNSEFFAGIVTGYNFGLIRKCTLQIALRGSDPAWNSASYIVTNKTLDRTFFVYVGGVAGKNAGIISACQLTGVDVEAIASHSFAGNPINDNKVFVYAGGITGYNAGKIGYSYVQEQDGHGKVTAKATSTLSPQADTSPYVTAFSGGICGKVDENALKSQALTEMMTCLYSDVSTVGKANIVFDDSKHTKGYSNRKENFNYDQARKSLDDLPEVFPTWYKILFGGVSLFVFDDMLQEARKQELIKQLKALPQETFEDSCYIPVYYGNYSGKITAEIIGLVKAESVSAVSEKISALQANYTVESITGLPSGDMSAATAALDVSNISAVIKKSGNPVTVKAVNVIGIFGFEAYNLSKISTKTMPNIVFLLDIVVQNGEIEEHIAYKATSNITLGVNALESINFDFSFGTLSWMQTGMEGIPYDETSALTLESLEGREGANTIYEYTATIESKVYNYSKLSDPTITVKRLKADDNGNLVVDEKGDPIVDETFTIWQSTDGSFYTDELGYYRATIGCTYDGEQLDDGHPMIVDYEVYCPHLVWEVETFGEPQHHDATCKDLGYDEYTCTLCGDKIQRGIQPLAEHKFENQEVQATCYSVGWTGYGICKVCGLEIGEEVKIPQKPHDYSVIVYTAKNGSLIYCKDGKYYSNEACTQILVNPSIKEENDRLISQFHLCTLQEANGAYHTEQHQYQVSASVNDEGNLVYTYFCACGYQYSVPTSNVITPEYLKLPVISVSQGYALKGGDEVVVYVQLLNNPGIFGANFGIRYDSRLVLKEYEDGNVIEGSLVKDDNAVSCGYNFVWANGNIRKADGNLLKLVFIVPEDVKKGDTFQIKVVYDIENGATGGLAVNVDGTRTTETQVALTEDGCITIVDQLPGDVNLDGAVDILDALEIAKFAVGKRPYTDEFAKLANVDLSRNVDLSDIVTILQSLTGGYGVNLLSQEFTVQLDYNGVDPTTLLNEESLPTSINVSIYGENNTYQLPTPQREGYHFDGWYTRMVDLVVTDENGKVIDICKHIESGDPVRYDSNQRVQTLYAHWTKNTVVFNANSSDAKGRMDNWSFGTEMKSNIYRLEYIIRFEDGVTKLAGGDSEIDAYDVAWISTISGWESRDAEGNVVKIYAADLSDVNLSSPEFGGVVTLYAVWQAPSVSTPSWTHKGYEADITWKYGTNTISTFTYSNVINNVAPNNEGKRVLTATFTPLQYTIEFNGNGATSGSKTPIENESLTSTTTITWSDTFTQAGYDRNGWGWSSDGSKDDGILSKDVSGIISYALQNNLVDSNRKITVYALWKNAIFNVSAGSITGGKVYWSVSEGGASAPILSDQEYGTTLYWNIQADEGYDNPAVSSGKLTLTTEYFTLDRKNARLKDGVISYIPTPHSYKVNLNSNTSVLPFSVSISTSSGTATYLSKCLTIYATESDAYFDIEGWYTEVSGGQMVADVNGNLCKNTPYTDDQGRWSKKQEGVTLYAHWKRTRSEKYIANTANNEIGVYKLSEMESSGNYLLIQDISVGTWTSKTSFDGVLNGNGHKISGLKISVSSQNQVIADGAYKGYGLFAQLKGTVKNVTFENASIVVSSPNGNEGAGFLYAGIVAGRAESGSLIENVKVYNSKVSVERDRSEYGGIAGVSDGTISNCNVYGIDMFGNGDEGGIAGGLCGTVKNCNVYGYTDGRKSTLRYYAVNGSRSCGGIVGYNNHGTISECNIFNVTFKLEAGYDKQPNMGFIVGYQNGGTIYHVGADLASCSYSPSKSAKEMKNRTNYYFSQGWGYSGKLKDNPSIE